MDPAMENIMALNGKTVQSFSKTRPSIAHGSHLKFMGTMIAIRNNPKALAILQKNMHGTHTFMAQEQVQLEFMEEIGNAEIQQQIQQMMQQMGPIRKQYSKIHNLCRYNK